MIIKTSDQSSIKPYLEKLKLPEKDSHKGQNGRALVIGGSSLFHSASIWAAEIASHFVDIVHYSSTDENNRIFMDLKHKFHNGIIITKAQLPEYIKEDDAILVGPGMIRSESSKSKVQSSKWEEVIKIQDEGEYTYCLTKYLIENFPEKKFVFDAGALQMMESDWLLNLKSKPIITPHQKEFTDLFKQDSKSLSIDDKKLLVQEYAGKYNCIILLKAVVDIISDGQETVIIEGGNAGLTKGGTGDLLAGLTVGLNTVNEPMISAIVASYLLKVSAERLFITHGYWYNIDNIIDEIPKTLANLVLQSI
jgi:ADP-dependent NAD(P)H-hydrate dehydratase / NAD(P)H-hydrate epimerase